MRSTSKAAGLNSRIATKRTAPKRHGRRRSPTDTRLDLDKLRTAIRKLSSEYVFYMLDEAIDLLPPAKLHRLVKQYLDVKPLRPEPVKLAKSSLLEEVKAFARASLAGEFYQAFDVNSKNCTEQSNGTSAWIATYRRWLDRCVTEASRTDPVEVRQAMDMIFGLLDHIDAGREDVIFFADEGGSWEVGIQWDKVLPVWFKALSATTPPEEYATRITALLERHYHYGRDKMLVVARRTATSDQRRALADLTNRPPKTL